LATLGKAANLHGAQEQEQKHRIMATAVLARSGVPIIGAVPVPIYAPDLTVDKIRMLDRQGKLPGNVRVSADDLATARGYVQLVLGSQAVVPTTSRPTPTRVIGGRVDPVTADCLRLIPQSPDPQLELRLPNRGAITIQPTQSGVLNATMVTEDGTGRA